METERAPDAAEPTRARLRLAASVVALMLLIACVGVGVYFASGMAGFDGEDPTAGRLVGRVGLFGAAALFLGTGPTAYFISRRRWTIATPVGAAVLAGVATVVASSK